MLIIVDHCFLSHLQTMDMFLSWQQPLVGSYVRMDTWKKKGAAGADIATTIARIMSISDASQIDADGTFVDLGLDSLMGVEIKQAIERDLSVTLSPKDIQTVG